MHDPILKPADYARAAANGISSARLYQRVNYGKFTVEEAINTPVQKQRKGIWAKWGKVATEHNISSATFYDRLRNGWIPERAATAPIQRKSKKQINI